MCITTQVNCMCNDQFNDCLQLFHDVPQPLEAE